MSKKLGALLIGLGICAVTSTALAETPFTAGKPSANLRLQYGINLEDGDLNPYGLGFAAGGGYTLDGGLYLGAGLDYFLGDSSSAGGLEVDLNVWQLMANVGYDLGLSPEFVLRPYAGLGLASMGGEICAGGQCTDDSESDLALSLGAAPIYSLGSVYLQGDARLNMIFGDETAKSFIIGAGVGMTF